MFPGDEGRAGNVPGYKKWFFFFSLSESDDHPYDYFSPAQKMFKRRRRIGVPPPTTGIRGNGELTFPSN